MCSPLYTTQHDKTKVYMNYKHRKMQIYANMKNKHTLAYGHHLYMIAQNTRLLNTTVTANSSNPENHEIT